MPKHNIEPDLGLPPDISDPDIIPPEMYEDRRLVSEEVVEEINEEIETELSEDELALFRSLLTVGRRTKNIDVLGHTVCIESLRVSDDLRIGLYCKEYEQSRAMSRAYQLAVCAAGVRTIDGTPLYSPLLETISDDEIFHQKVERLKNYYPIVINQVYNEILALDAEFAEVAVKLGKLKG